jgi:hypothetical protein
MSGYRKFKLLTLRDDDYFDTSKSGISKGVSFTDFNISWLDSLFVPKEPPVPIETEAQRKLRELKEKHAELGKAIEAMENTDE